MLGMVGITKRAVLDSLQPRGSEFSLSFGYCRWSRLPQHHEWCGAAPQRLLLCQASDPGDAKRILRWILFRITHSIVQLAFHVMLSMSNSEGDITVNLVLMKGICIS